MPEPTISLIAGRFYGKTWSRVADKVSDVVVDEKEVKKALDALRGTARAPQPNS